MLLKVMENNFVPDMFSAIHCPKQFQNNFQLLHSTDQMFNRHEGTAITTTINYTNVQIHMKLRIAAGCLSPSSF